MLIVIMLFKDYSKTIQRLFKNYLKTIQRIYWNNLHLIIQNIKSYEKYINVYITILPFKKYKRTSI